MKKAKPLTERFWSKVDTTTTPNGCWPWTGCKGSPYAYGYIGMKVDGTWRYVATHRLSWEMANSRPVPKGREICHICNNPSCVRPDHLYLGDHSGNARDAIANGVLFGKRGEENENHLLTWEQAREIRYLYSRRGGRYARGVSQRKLAAKFGVSRRTIRAVLSHRSWKE